MSYISAIRNRDVVTVWERTENGREAVQYAAPYYFYVEDPAGEYNSLYGHKLTRLDFETGHAFNLACDKFRNSNFELFESDLTPVQKVLSEYYYNKPAPDLHISFYDIEVDYNPEVGFASVQNPYAPINSVAIHNFWEKKTYLLAVPPPNWDGNLDPELHKLAKIKICKDERELLTRFLDIIEDSDALCGWNSDFFDAPYVCKRLEKVLRHRLPDMSFRGAYPPKFREVERFGKQDITVDIFGRLSIDYMILFKKYEMAERPSYSLEAITNEILPELPKLEYEGTLHGLYRNDFNFFLRYNIRDTECLEGFEKKLGYVALSNEMYHLSTGEFKNVTGTIKLAELAIVNYCHQKLNVIAPDTHVPLESESIQGAFVLLPQVGMHDWIGSIDINSLYPSAIRSINISPEMLRGQFLEKNRATEEIAKKSDVELTFEVESDHSLHTMPAKEWHDKLKGARWAVSGYGTVFSQKEKGIIPMVLEDWYATRKHYQKLKKEALANNDKLLAGYYDRLQYVYKIKLNSLYGALTNRHFKFYDLRMGESTTGTGRMILVHQCAEACKVLDNQYMTPDIKRHESHSNGGVQVVRDHYGYSDKWSVLYGDTDSTYFKIPADNREDAIRIADEVGEKVNQSFQKFMQETFLCTPEFDNIIAAGREVVSDRGIFVDKKRYILHIIDNEGEAVDKLKVMGLDTKKTTLPKVVSKCLNHFIERLLKGESWDDIKVDIVEYKEDLMNSHILDIGLPKGCQKIEYYTQELKVYGDKQRLPGHVAAAINYNTNLEAYKDMESMRITSGMKVKVYYLKQKDGRFRSIALPTDIEVVPKWFIDDYVPRIDFDAQLERLVDNPLKNILKAIGKEPPSRQSLLVDSLLIW